jgi:hypothetical protein
LCGLKQGILGTVDDCDARALGGECNGGGAAYAAGSAGYKDCLAGEAIETGMDLPQKADEKG